MLESENFTVGQDVPHRIIPSMIGWDKGLSFEFAPRTTHREEEEGSSAGMEQGEEGVETPSRRRPRKKSTRRSSASRSSRSRKTTSRRSSRRRGR